MISGKTEVYGIFGYPVEHTFSPGMHNAAFKTLGINACYVPFAVPPERIGDAVRAILPLGIRGLNVTVPHKQNVIPHLHELSEEARLIGAVNTIQVKSGGMIGHNTDGRGFLRSLNEDAGFRPKGKSFLILGSGGAARAVGFSLALAGAGVIALFDVDGRKARMLSAELTKKTGTQAVAAEDKDLAAFAAGADCIINATPMGLKKNDPLPIPGEYIAKKHLVYDLVYNPPNTRLLKVAKSAGASRLGGIGMLLYQGVIAFEIWTGKKAPVAVMKRALLSQMRMKR